MKRFIPIASIVAGLVFIYLIRNALLPFVAAFIIAYLFQPFTNWLFKKTRSRAVAALIPIVLTIIFLVGFCLVVIPIVLEELVGMTLSLPQYTQYLPKITNVAITEKILANASDIITVAKNGIFSSVIMVMEILLFLLLTPILGFYFLRDWDKIYNAMLTLVPEKHKNRAIAECKLIDKTIFSYVKGQLLVCLFLSIFYGAMLGGISLNSGFAIGVMTGALSIIPYFGIIVGITLSIITALHQWNYAMEPLFVVLGIFAIGQIADSNFITPRVMSQQIGLHPAWIIFSLLSGGILLGIFGVLIAIPIAALAQIFIKETLAKRKDV